MTAIGSIHRSCIDVQSSPIRSSRIIATMGDRVEIRTWRRGLAAVFPAVLAAALVAGCAGLPSEHAVPESPVPEAQAAAIRAHAALLARLGSDQLAAVLGQAAVQTPEGLWNVYVLSAPPDRVLVHQVRQQTETVFGMNADQLWGYDLISGVARWLSPELRFFVRNHELLRFGDRLEAWQPIAISATKVLENVACDEVLRLLDESGHPIDLCLAADGLPALIRLMPPPAYGDQPMLVYPRHWLEHEGEPVYLQIYELVHGADRYHWNFQGIERLDQSEVRIEPPESLINAVDVPD